MEIKDIPPKQYIKPFRAEAGIVVNNTEHIQEVVQDYREQLSNMKEAEAFEKVVNLKFKHPEREEVQTIKFETKNYFNEANRLSKQPHLYKHAPKNPIYTFVPENFNFQISQSHDQEKKGGKANIRFSKMMNSHTGFMPLQDQESISQMKEIEDLEEYDAESLMKTQSIRLSTLRIPLKTPQRVSQQQNRGSLPQLQHGRNQGAYPFNVFDSAYIQRKRKINPVITPAEKNLEEKKIFLTTFKSENVATLKHKLATKEPITDAYNPVSQAVFREETTPDKNHPFVMRFKCDPLKNPYGMSEHDSRPKEALEREQREKRHKNQEDQQKINEFMGKVGQDKNWINYFKLADMDHNFVDQQRPLFLEKGEFLPPSAVLHNLLRGESEYSDPFKLFHRTLRACDKNYVLGQVPDSKF